MLAVHADRPVGRDELIDGIWGSAPPVTAANCVHSYVARLRLVLEPGRPAHTPSRILVSSGPGYALRLDAGPGGASAFAGHLLPAGQLRARGDLAGGAVSLDAALSLWHGTPLAGIPGPFAEAERVRLSEEYLTAAEDRAEFMLATGGQEHVAGQLAQLVREHPFRERLAGLYMLALFRSGRQAEALAAYQRTRQILVDELGLEPGQELRRIHEDILHGRASDLARGPGAAAPGRAAAVAVTPHQLPPAIPHFTGRQAELRSLDGLAATADATAGRPVISVISGTAGVGKTALAVRHAHKIAELFPDGQLYVN